MRLIRSFYHTRNAFCRARFFSVTKLPEHAFLELPALSPTMSAGRVASWTAKVGDRVNAGEVFCEIETDKATVAYEAQDDAYLAKILVEAPSDEITVGQCIGITVEEAGDVAAFANYVHSSAGDAAPASTPSPSTPPPAAATSTPVQTPPPAANYPEHMVMELPALSPTMSHGKIAKWLKQEGESFSAGDPLCEIETDKATVSYDAQEDGIIAKILVQAGDTELQVGEPIGIVVDEAKDMAAFASYVVGGAPPAAAAPVAAEAAPAAVAEESQAGRQPMIQFTHGKRESDPAAPAAGGRIKVSPLAKSIAAEQGLALSLVTGTGPGGRIVADDVRKAIAAGVGKAPVAAAAAQPSAAPAAAAPGQVGAASPAVVGTVPYIGVFAVPPRTPEEGPVETIKLTGMRKAIARRLSESKVSIPHYQVTMDCELDKLMATRAMLNKILEKKGTKLSVNDFVVKASAYALQEVPECNSFWRGDHMIKNNFVDISIAVDVGNGLITPIVRNVENKGLADISSGVKALRKKATENKILPTDIEGGTFTISNMGMFGVKGFNAIINPPQSCILAVSGAQSVLKPADNERGFRKATVMEVTLSSDHRVVDGAAAARWLNAFKSVIENPEVLFI